MRAGPSSRFGTGSRAKLRPGPGGHGGFFLSTLKLTFWDGLSLSPFRLLCVSTKKHLVPQ